MPVAQYAFLLSWMIQGAVAATFLVALAGLAMQLHRPGAAILAQVWVVMTVACLLAIGQGLTRPDEGMLVFGTVSYLLVGLSFSTVPLTRAAAEAVASSGRRVVPYRRRALIIGTAGFAVAIGVKWGAEAAFGADTAIALMIPRFLIAAAFGWAGLEIWRVRRSADARYRLVLAVFSLGALTQVPRPFLSVALDQWARDPAVTDLAASLYILQHVAAVVILGVTSFLLALSEERFATIDTGKQLRETALRLEHSHRLESLGRLAGGVAHDFNNLLAAITSASYLARGSAKDESRLGAELDAIDEASERGAALTRQLKDFARMDPRAPERFDATERVRQGGGFLRRLVGSTVSLRIEEGTGQDHVLMDPTQFDQVLLNLVVNARDAMPKGGTIQVRVERCRFEVPRALDEVELAAGEYVRMTVHDTGIGIPAELGRTIFEPFVSTRVSSGGTGLGLATVLSAVRAARGDITFTSTPGEGTEFEVLLPRAP